MGVTEPTYSAQPSPVTGRTGERGTSRFSRMEVPYMRRVSDRAGPASDSR